MEENHTKILELWEKEACSHIQKYVPYQASQQLKQMCAFFAPGLSYFYILNFHNLKMDYVDSGTNDVLGIPPEAFGIKKLLEIQSPEGLKIMEKKEALIADFLFNFLTPQEIPLYKIVYFLRLRHADGKYRNVLHQVTTLTVSDTGKVEHVLGVHTDLSHLGAINNDRISLIGLSGNPSYFNLDPEMGSFDPENCNSDAPSISDGLTKREVEIIKLLAEGLTANQIAGKLIISENTVRTHRKNMLLKAECSNITELVARCMVEGVI